MRTSITFTNPNPNTIYNRLSARLGRPATDAECIAEVKRILSETMTQSDQATEAMEGRR